MEVERFGNVLSGPINILTIIDMYATVDLKVLFILVGVLTTTSLCYGNYGFENSLFIYLYLFFIIIVL